MHDFDHFDLIASEKERYQQLIRTAENNRRASHARKPLQSALLSNRLRQAGKQLFAIVRRTLSVHHRIHRRHVV